MLSDSGDSAEFGPVSRYVALPRVPTAQTMDATASIASTAFQPSALLRNPHIQSVAGRLPARSGRIANRARPLVESARRLVLDAGSGIRLAGYLSPAAATSRGLVVLIHGWEGCANSHYMLSAGALLQNAGFDVFRLNLRDHGDTFDLNEELFHSCRIDEVVNAIRTLQTSLRPRRLAVVGHSLGGNFAIRVAIRAPAQGIGLDRVFAVAPVVRPASTMRALEEGLWLYRRYFLNRWRQSLYRKAALFPNRYQFGDLGRLKTLTATTDFFVRHYTEMESLEAYLEGYALTGDRLATLSVPTHAIFAADDPIIPLADVELLARPAALDIEVCRYGGHCGFVDTLRGNSWIDERIAEDVGRRL